ncbi:MAG: hypothetical protein HRT45_07830 [Bdellovibrionales bacterium]|nr:hypothetical protein [Bdellovibrionales bacterium]
MTKNLSVWIGLCFMAAGSPACSFRDASAPTPEVACRNAKPGDPTCMSTESLTEWCANQENVVALPQCMGLKGIYPVEAIVKEILEYQPLQQYFHSELEGRSPLVLSDNLINVNLRLEKFSQPVRIVADSKVKGAFLRFTTFDCKKTGYCNVVFEYPIEGVEGSTGVTIAKDGSVKLEKISLAEK